MSTPAPATAPATASTSAPPDSEGELSAPRVFTHAVLPDAIPQDGSRWTGRGARTCTRFLQAKFGDDKRD